MDFKDYISKVKSLRPGTEGNLKVQREEVINSFRIIQEQLTKIGNTLTTEFATKTLRETGYACYGLITTIREMDSLIKNTTFFDFSNKGIINYFNSRLSGLKVFRKVICGEHNRDHIGNEQIYFIIELKPPYEESEVIKQIKETLREFEFCHRDHTYRQEKGKNTMRVEINFMNRAKIQTLN